MSIFPITNVPLSLGVRRFFTALDSSSIDDTNFKWLGQIERGSSGDATAPGGSTNYPVYTTNVINGRPAYFFDSALNKYFTWDGTILANQDYTVICVEQRGRGGHRAARSSRENE